MVGYSRIGDWVSAGADGSDARALNHGPLQRENRAISAVTMVAGGSASGATVVDATTASVAGRITIIAGTVAAYATIQGALMLFAAVLANGTEAQQVLVKSGAFVVAAGATVRELGTFDLDYNAVIITV